MGLQIESGTGNAAMAEVTDDNRLNTSSRSNPRIAYVSRNAGESYKWAHSYDHDAADTILLVSNSSTTKRLYIHGINVSADTATEFVIHSPAYPTLAGTTVTATNTNRTSGHTADAEAYGDETGNTQANVLSIGAVPANGTVGQNPSGTLILGYHDCIAVDLVTAGTKGRVTIGGYFE